MTTLYAAAVAYLAACDDFLRMKPSDPARDTQRSFIVTRRDALRRAVREEEERARNTALAERLNLG